MSANDKPGSDPPVIRFSVVHRLKHRLGAFASPYLKSTRYRVLLALVLIGMLLISVLPEASFLLPSLDAIGLDIVTLIAALELRHYAAFVLRRLGLDLALARRLRVSARGVFNRLAIAWDHPVLCLYACTWLLIGMRWLHGSRPPQI